MSSEAYDVKDIPVVNRAVPPMPLMRNDEIVQQPMDFDTATDAFTDEAINFIRENAGNRFFLVVNYYQPHVPLQPSPRFRGLTRRGIYGDVVAEMDNR